MKKEKIYNKLVRDNMLEILDKKGFKYTYEIIDDEDEYKLLLYSKFYEYSIEFMKDPSMYGLSDILDIIYSVLKLGNKTMDELEDIRLEKQKHKGSFDKKIFLNKVIKE